MPFVDGEPLDASILNKLNTRLNIIESKIPTFGSSNPNISLQSSGQESIPEIRCGTSESIPIDGPVIKWPIDFGGENMKKNPTVVACIAGGESDFGISIRVKTITPSGFHVSIYSPKEVYSSKGKSKIRINYIAIAY